jgi:hypothetical protein
LGGRGGCFGLLLRWLELWRGNISFRRGVSPHILLFGLWALYFCQKKNGKLSHGKAHGEAASYADRNMFRITGRSFFNFFFFILLVLLFFFSPLLRHLLFWHLIRKVKLLFLFLVHTYPNHSTENYRLHTLVSNNKSTARPLSSPPSFYT